MKLKWKILVIITLAVVAISGGIFMFLYREIDEDKHYSLEGIDEIQATVSSAPVHIVRTEPGNEVRFHFYGKSLQEINLVSEIRNKTLIVEPRRKYFFFGTAEITHLDIYVPGEYGRKLFLKTTSGSVKLDSFSLMDFTLNTSSGDLETETIEVGKITVNTTSGRINLKKLGANELEIKGTSSLISVGECVVKEARIKTTSGKVTLENSIGNLNVQSTSGRILVTCCEFQDRNIVFKTTSGSVTLGLPRIAEFSIEAKTASGKFQSDFPISLSQNVDERTITGQIGMAKNKISVQTTSGQVKVYKNNK